jgi:hypothetical protein
MIAGLAAALCLSVAAGAQAGESVPLIGRFDTSFTLTPTSIPGVFTVDFSGSGEVSHMGRTTVASPMTVDFRSSPNPMAGPVVFTAASGDELHASLSGLGSPADASGNTAFTGTLTFTGGTGRFSGASGHAAFSGAANVVSLKGAFTFSGTLAR